MAEGGGGQVIWELSTEKCYQNSFKDSALNIHFPWYSHRLGYYFKATPAIIDQSTIEKK